MEEYHKSICQCCHTPFKVRQLSYWKSSLSDIGKVSPRLQEYFQILLFLMLVLLILFVLTGVIQIVFNPSIVKCGFFKCESIHKLSIQIYYSGLGDSKDFGVFSAELMMLISLFLIFVLKTLFYGYLLRQKRRNEGQYTIKHYSVHVENLSSTRVADIKKEVLKEFSQKFKLGEDRKLVMKEDDILYVSRFRNLSNMHSLIKKFMNLSKKRKILRIKYKDRKKFDIKRQKVSYRFEKKSKVGSAEEIDVKDLVGDIPIQVEFKEVERKERSEREENDHLLSVNRSKNVTINSDEPLEFGLSMNESSKMDLNQYSPIDSLPRAGSETKKPSKGILKVKKIHKMIKIPKMSNGMRSESSPMIMVNNKIASLNEIQKKRTRSRNVFKSNQSEQENGDEITMADRNRNINGDNKGNGEDSGAEIKTKNHQVSKMYDRKKKGWKVRKKIETLMDRRYREKDKKLEEEIKTVVKKITTVRTDKSKMLNEAIITFNRVELARVMVSNYWKRMSCEYFGNKTTFYKRANQPLDIIWQNYNDSRSWRRTKIIIFFFIAVGMIAFNCWVVTMIKTRQTIYLENRRSQMTSTTTTTTQGLSDWAFWFNLIILVSIITINFLLRKFMEFLSSFENRKFYTEFQISKILKISMLLFMNTAFVLFATTVILSLQGKIEENFGELFGDEGLVFSMQLIMLSSITTPLIWSLLNPEHLLLHWHYLWARKKCRKSKNNRYIQEELNLIFQRFDFEIDFKYYMILKTVSIAMFFQLIIPLGTLVAFLELVLYFVLDKHILLARCERPKQMEFSLTKNVLRLIDKCLLLIPIGHLVFFRLYLNKQNNQVIFWISFVMTFVEAFVISWRSLFRCCKKSVLANEESPDFKSVAHAVLKYTDINPAECHINFSASVKSNRAISTRMSHKSFIPTSQNVSMVSRNPSFMRFGGENGGDRASTSRNSIHPNLNPNPQTQPGHVHETNDQMFLSLVNSVIPGNKRRFLKNRKKETKHFHNEEKLDLITQYEKEILKEDPSVYQLSQNVVNDYSPRTVSKRHEDRIVMMSNMRGFNKNFHHIKQMNGLDYRTSINRISQMNSQVYSVSKGGSLYERQDNQKMLMSVPKNTRLDAGPKEQRKFDFHKNIQHQNNNNFTPNTKNAERIEEDGARELQEAETNVNTVSENTDVPFTFLPKKKTTFEFENSDRKDIEEEIRETKVNDSDSKNNSLGKYVLGGISESQELKSQKKSDKGISRQNTKRIVDFGDGENINIRVSKSINTDQKNGFAKSVFSLRASRPIRPMTRTITSQEHIEMSESKRDNQMNHQTTSAGGMIDSQSSSFKKTNNDFLSKEGDPQLRSSQDILSSRKSFRDALDKIRLDLPGNKPGANPRGRVILISQNVLEIPIPEEPENEISKSEVNSGSNLNEEIEYDRTEFGTFGREGYQKKAENFAEGQLSSSFKPPAMAPKDGED